MTTSRLPTRSRMRKLPSRPPTTSPLMEFPVGAPVRRPVSMARVWPALIQDSEDGMVGCYPLAVREGRCGAEADMRSSSRREPDVLLDDGRSTLDRHLFELHLAASTADDVGLTPCPHIFHPFTLSEHRYEIVLALIPGYDER